MFQRALMRIDAKEAQRNHSYDAEEICACFSDITSSFEQEITDAEQQARENCHGSLTTLTLVYVKNHLDFDEDYLKFGEDDEAYFPVLCPGPSFRIAHDEAFFSMTSSDRELKETLHVLIARFPVEMHEIEISFYQDFEVLTSDSSEGRESNLSPFVWKHACNGARSYKQFKRGVRINYAEVEKLEKKEKNIVSEMEKVTFEIMARFMGISKCAKVSWDVLEGLSSEMYPDLRDAIENFKITTAKVFS